MDLHTSPGEELEPLYLYILSLLPVRKLEVFGKWRQVAGSFEAVYLASEKQLANWGWGLELIIKLRQIKAEHSLEKLYLLIQQTAVQTLPYYDNRYPNLLKQIYDAPPVLFYRGQLGDPGESCVAIVGSRAMSSYGVMMTSRIAEALINAGVTIVSGLALGIDSAAHAESVKQGKRTIAVLGSGVDEASVYPRSHFRLSQQILDNGGLLISEQPPQMPALKHHFVARNRIIAGLSLGVAIIECKMKSGALITADFAADFNRSLYAVPGPAYSKLCDGPHHLIRSGARLITSGEEILEDLSLEILNSKTSSKTQSTSLTENERLVLECMQASPVTIDSIAQSTKLAATEISQIVTMMELRGAIKNLGIEGFIKV